MNDIPDWFKLLSLEDSMFEKSFYASNSNSPKFRLKDLGVLRKVMTNFYEAAAEEVKEHNQYYRLEGGKVALGKKVGSIPLYDFSLHPELMNDKKEQDKYWKEHPEMRAEKQG